MTGPTTTRRRKRRKNRQQGVAVLLVLACLAILAPFTATFNYQARVDWQSAVNVRDEIAARQIQRGAMQLSLLLFEIQKLVFNQRQFREFMGTMDITQVAPYLMSVFGTSDGAQGLGDMVGIDTTALQELALKNGSFEYRVMAESGKINVNCLAIQAKAGDKTNLAGQTVETLEALMAPTLYDPLFEEEKSNGQYYARADVVRAIADYIDDDRQRFDIIKLRSGSAQENDRYGELFDPYYPRNARLDSVEELQLVAGIDDDWMTAFGAELTVYGGDCKVNLNFASAEQIALVIRHSVTAADRHKTEGDQFMIKVMPLANYVVDMREYNLFEKLDDFQKLVAKPDQYVNPMLAMGMGDPTLQQLPRIPEGIELQTKVPKDQEDTGGSLTDIATVTAERVYRIEVITTVGAVNKRLQGVYDMQYARSQSQGKGAWLYLRED